MVKLQTDLLKGNIIKSLLIFSLPILISNIFQTLYTTMDTMIVGNYLGDVSLAAIGACTAIYDLLVGFALGIGNGLSIVTARSYGSGDKKLLKKSVAGSIVIGIFVTVIVMIVSTLFLKPILNLLGTPENIINESYEYISALTICVGVMFAYNLFSGLLRAIGNSVMPLVFLIVSSVLNIGLDILFIAQFNMGIRGAAVATVIAQGISAVLCLIYICKKASVLIPSKDDFKFDKELYKELIGQGFSMGFMMCIVSAGTVILQSAINNLGYLIIAGHTSARKLCSFTMMPVGTLALAMATFVSQNKGAGQGQRIRKAIRYGIYLSIAWGAILTVLMYFAAPAAVKLISGSKESTVIDNGARYLMINAPFHAVLGVLCILRNALQGIGKKVVPLVSSIIELLGKIIFVIIFIPSLKYFGVIICEPVIWCFMCAQLIYAFYRDPFIKSFK